MYKAAFIIAVIYKGVRTSYNQNRVAVRDFLHHFFEKFIGGHEVFVEEAHGIIKLMPKRITSILQVRIAPLVVISHIHRITNVAHQHTDSLFGAFRKHLVGGIFHVAPPVSVALPGFVALGFYIVRRAFFRPFVVIHHLCRSRSHTARGRSFSIHNTGIFVKRKVLTPLASEQRFHFAFERHGGSRRFPLGVAHGFYHAFIIAQKLFEIRRLFATFL